jgi:hypothetical protein
MNLDLETSLQVLFFAVAFAVMALAFFSDSM